jgi:protein gp37
MSDLFHEAVPVDAQSGVFDVAYSCPQHTFYILTKRPQNMSDILKDSNFFGHGCLRNVWLGVTTENQETASQRIPILLSIPAAIHFISAEPLLESLGDIQKWLGLRGIQFVIAGPETGAGARPCDPEWIVSIAADCEMQGVPFFDKRDNGIRRESP